MKRVILSTMVVLLSLTLVNSAFAFGGMRGHRPGGLKMLEMMKGELDLSEEQVANLRDLMVDHQKQEIELRSQIEVARLELEELMVADKPNKTAALKKVEEIGNFQTEIRKLDVGFRIEMKTILTPEQLEKWDQMRADRPRRGRHGLGPHGPGWGAPHGPGPHGRGWQPPRDTE
ncbi:MAG: periplasmic heavy metal sensor [Gemmatimonadetes bacterium]|nr:MAG: periplasmic heavy metal sensor [Gemmatimonadota bacterium]